jgi:amino acid adenylation domain-containing protein
MQTYSGALQTFVLPADLLAALKSLIRREGVTLYMALLAAFEALLSRYTGQEDISVGTTVAGRDRAETEALIGFFVNTLVMRTNLSGNPSFRELLERVREVALGAYTHQDIPFEKLVEHLQPERELNRNPLFQVMFEIQNFAEESVRLPGLTIAPVFIENTTAKFDLTLLVSESEEGLIAKFEYSTDLFDAVTIERLGQHFQTLLTGMVARPEQSFADVPLLTGAEQRQLLDQWNDTRSPSPQDKCFQELFEQQAERIPDKIAVGFKGQSLTYLELNQRANRLAHYLRSSGVGPEIRVGVCVERGPDLLIGLLAILKAGGVYVPLDPAYPKERLAYILDDAQAPLMLAQHHLLERLPEQQARVLCLDSELAVLEHESELNPDSGVEPANLAYIIYTSGSTGRPKGAMVEHRGMLNHLYAKFRDLHLTNDDVIAQTSSQSFDISIWQLLAASLAGGRVEMFDDEVAQTPSRLVQMTEREGITILETVPALLRGMLGVVELQETLSRQLASLRWLIVTGEALPPELARQWLERYPHIPLMNAYGPTECSDDVTHHVARELPSQSAARMPIGRPVINTRIYILDRRLRPLPVGVPGELCVAGIGVGRGYLNQPGLTALTFVADPFASKPGARLYKTGDLARYLPDGEIEFLGRIDHQVKMRGFRIELGEIESALNKHSAVGEAVVMLSAAQPGDERLLAYVVPAPDSTPASADLRHYLKQRLPEYMVPSAFVMLEALPLTGNGKLDRRALERMSVAGPINERAFVAPRTPVEEAVAGIWAELLKLERVGVHDNFFDSGGHSLLAIQVLTQLLKTFQVDLQLRTFFEAPTVAELSERVIASETKPGQTEKIARILQKVGRMSAEDKQEILERKRLERGKAQ